MPRAERRYCADGPARIATFGNRKRHIAHLSASAGMKGARYASCGREIPRVTKVAVVSIPFAPFICAFRANGGKDVRTGVRRGLFGMRQLVIDPITAGGHVALEKPSRRAISRAEKYGFVRPPESKDVPMS